MHSKPHFNVHQYFAISTVCDFGIVGYVIKKLWTFGGMKNKMIIISTDLQETTWPTTFFPTSLFLACKQLRRKDLNYWLSIYVHCLEWWVCVSCLPRFRHRLWTMWLVCRCALNDMWMWQTGLRVFLTDVEEIQSGLVPCSLYNLESKQT